MYYLQDSIPENNTLCTDEIAFWDIMNYIFVHKHWKTNTSSWMGQKFEIQYIHILNMYFVICNLDTKLTQFLFISVKKSNKPIMWKGKGENQ